MSHQPISFAPSASAGLAQENDLLRAALADAQRRIEELEALAEADSLTGLANARRFAREVERVAGYAERHATPAALLSIDLRGVGEINEQFGRPVGDAAIAQVARTLSGLIRSTDQLSRTGGSEFGLLLDHLDHNSAIETAERLAHCIARAPLTLGGRKIPLHVVVATTGIIPGDEAASVLDRARINLARAKEDA